ncbi:MAG: protein translocase subunit SecF [Deltaproteobacteria bacterium]|nr:MAG: protein translocase subunit SecF [Deltaproteobacteria bacterium]
MEIIRPGTTIDFIGKRKIAAVISIAVILIGIVSLVMKGGPRYGIDFAGGTMIQVAFKTDVTTEGIRDALAGVIEGTPVIQSFVGKDNEYIIQMEEVVTTDLNGVEELVKGSLGKAFGQENVSVSQAQMVGPKVGKDLREKGILAIIASMGMVLLYIWWRFELHFGVGAIAALVHDVLVTVGLFSLLDKQFDLTIIAALLTIVGYSLNDTIVVYDRARENLKKVGGRGDIAAIFNKSINETLGRTILTSITTLLVVVALFVLGGGVIHDFAFALLVGVVVGTYSSVYVASPVVLLFNKRVAREAKAQAKS